MQSWHTALFGGRTAPAYKAPRGMEH
jgi:hypothetical protein